MFPRLQFILPTFKFRPGKGVFWGATVGLGVFCVRIYPQKECVTADLYEKLAKVL